MANDREAVGEAAHLLQQGTDLRMDDFGHGYRLVKIVVGGIAALLLGLGLICTGELQAIISGIGALLAAVLVFGFVGWTYKDAAAPPEADRPTKADDQTRVFWLGIALTLLPGLLYLYLRYAMSRFDPLAVIFVSVPLLGAGLGCIGVSILSISKKK